ncbi:methionyl-tRNA formyltransferase [Spiroplasma eriocheiris]|uniref:Methionyl-tRNA formyltransferase n=1 Tax=Spiroplasma eriocheiris TaxID=315358 RepID=A0A0H3XJM7_9MOLU|nr:methionyl-tRNA formyltransferase [Spiroplasma eriocheiris]AHF57606.1 methionyl-tRNA formyltransferase [Spiroplasma eriocheiris CCTCC M 207170]AKM54061.1 methionyl-tRNA formyltransferase [Spiroplasma eriocheiris]
MKKYRVIFMGTPMFATSVLKTLLEMKNQFEIVGVVCQPDRKTGRKQEVQFSPVKQLALAKNLLVFQPEKLIDAYEELAQLQPDLILTCAYGQFIPSKILALPTINCLNVHASLLPKLRGGAPIHKAIIYGEHETGISLMQMVKKMDAGDVYYQNKLTISLTETASSLHDKLMLLAIDIIKHHLIPTLENKYHPVPQDETKVTFAYNITREEERINWNQIKENIYNQIRGLYAWPIAYTTINDKIYKIHEAKISLDHLSTSDQQLANGTIVALTKEGIKIKVINGYLILLKIQREGKKPVETSVFYNNPSPEIAIHQQFV